MNSILKNILETRKVGYCVQSVGLALCASGGLLVAMSLLEVADSGGLQEWIAYRSSIFGLCLVLLGGFTIVPLGVLIVLVTKSWENDERIKMYYNSPENTCSISDKIPGDQRG